MMKLTLIQNMKKSNFELSYHFSININQCAVHCKIWISCSNLFWTIQTGYVKSKFKVFFIHFKSTVDQSCTNLILFQLGTVSKNLGEEMVPVMMEIITLIVILMMETVVDLVSIDNIAQIVYACLKIQMLQVINSLS